MSGRKEGVVFVGSFRENFPEDHRRHVVFVGRSNVGKSSLINMLVGTTQRFLVKKGKGGGL
jgi:GTP-binding protein